MNLPKKITANKVHEKIKNKLILNISVLVLSAKEKEETRLKLEIAAEELRRKAKQLAINAKQLETLAIKKEEARLKLEIAAEELRKKAKQLETVAINKEEARIKLAIVAKELRKKAKLLVIVAKEKEDSRVKLVIVAKKLAVTAKQLKITAKKLAMVAKEKEIVRRKLAEVAKKLQIKARNENKIQKELKESEIRYRRLFESAHDGILILNSKTAQITDANPFLERLLGYSKNEFLNKKLWDVGVFKNIKETKEVFELLQEDGILRYDDLPLETKDGKSVSVEFVSNSYMEAGTLVIQCNIRDITERKKLEQAKEVKRLFDEEIAKVDSIADATHELRTPVAIIKGNVDLAMLNKGEDIKSYKSVLRAIDYEVSHLSNILSDLTLITSRGKELKNKVIFKEVKIRSLVAGVIKRSKGLSYKKNISITAGKIPDVSIKGDKVYLEKMLINLIKNSIIYGNKNGHTKITAEEFNGIITISVIDNGIGISKEDLPHVFERFYRADKSHSSSEGNSIGLGLAIVKWVAEAHGGKVSVKNTKNKGSIFDISLPIKNTNLKKL